MKLVPGHCLVRIGAADPGDAGPDDHDVEVLDLLGCGFGEYCHLGHSGAVAVCVGIGEDIGSSSEVNRLPGGLRQRAGLFARIFP